MGRVSSIKIERCVVVINAAARVSTEEEFQRGAGGFVGLGGSGSLGARWGHFRPSGRKNNDRAGTQHTLLPRADLFN